MRFLAGLFFALTVFWAAAMQLPQTYERSTADYAFLAGEICGQPMGNNAPRGVHCPLCIVAPPAILPGMAALPLRLARRFRPDGRPRRRLSVPPGPHPCPFACGPPLA